MGIVGLRCEIETGRSSQKSMVAENDDGCHHDDRKARSPERFE